MLSFRIRKTLPCLVIKYFANCRQFYIGSIRPGQGRRQMRPINHWGRPAAIVSNLFLCRNCLLMKVEMRRMMTLDIVVTGSWRSWHSDQIRVIKSRFKGIFTILLKYFLNLDMFSIGLKYFWRSCPSQYVFIFWSCNIHNVCLHFFLTMFLDLFLFLNIKIDDCQYLRSQFLKN